MDRFSKRGGGGKKFLKMILIPPSRHPSIYCEKQSLKGALQNSSPALFVRNLEKELCIQ